MASPALLRGRMSRLGAYYLVTTVCLHRAPLLAVHAAAAAAMSELRRSDAARLTESVAWVVMPEHVHWLFELGIDDLGRAVGSFKSRTALALNGMRMSSGPVWQAGYHDRRMRDARECERAARYILDNPRRRGLVECLDQYPYWCCRGFDPRT